MSSLCHGIDGILKATRFKLLTVYELEIVDVVLHAKDAEKFFSVSKQTLVTLLYQVKQSFKATNVVDQLSHILQTPEEVKGFLNFAVHVEGINLTNCLSGHGSIATCALLITNPLASFTIQVF